MTPQYSYVSSIEFINKLDFEYMATYSLQRGAAFEERSIQEFKEYKGLKSRHEKKGDLSELEISILENLNKFHGITQYIINAEGEFHPSAELTGSFKKNDYTVEKLKLILNTPIEEIPGWMCAPIYRDAIVFYDSQNKVVSALNVCLSCEYMETKMFHHVNADETIYTLLREFFIELGHKVEEK